MESLVAALFVCCTCHQKGFPCACVSYCDRCGMIFNNTVEQKCSHRVHDYDAEVANAFKDGYWRVDETSGMLYKTRSSNIQRIYQELDKWNVFFSRKEFNKITRSLQT